MADMQTCSVPCSTNLVLHTAKLHAGVAGVCQRNSKDGSVWRWLMSITSRRVLGGVWSSTAA